MIEQKTLVGKPIKRAIPPKDYLAFKWKRENRGGYTVALCPICGESGFLFDGKPGFQDKTAMSLYRQARKKKLEEPFLLWIEAAYLKDHWSRYGTGRCLNCGCRIWHDFRCDHEECSCGKWHYYYNPFPTICKWIGKPRCKFYDSQTDKEGRVHTGKKILPFELCDDDHANEKIHFTCQPSTMGYGSKEEFLKDVDKNKITYWIQN